MMFLATSRYRPIEESIPVSKQPDENLINQELPTKQAALFFCTCHPSGHAVMQLDLKRHAPLLKCPRITAGARHEMEQTAQSAEQQSSALQGRQDSVTQVGEMNCFQTMTRFSSPMCGAVQSKPSLTFSVISSCRLCGIGIMQRFLWAFICPEVLKMKADRLLM